MKLTEEGVGCSYRIRIPFLGHGVTRMAHGYMYAVHTTFYG